jgi:hypothetical protein
MGKVNNNSRSESLVDASLYFMSCISTGKPADWVTDKYSLSPRRERDRVRGRNELYFILFCPCEDFFSCRCEERSDEAISSIYSSIIVRGEVFSFWFTVFRKESLSAYT